MKKIFGYSLIIFSLFSQGCLEIKTLINVNKDGSGTIEETVIMSEKVIEMMKGFSTAFSSDSTQQPEFNIFDEKNLKERASSFGKGVVYVSGEKIQEETKEGFSALYSFKNLEDISLKKIPQNELPLSITETAEKDLEFKFKKGSPSEIIISFPEMKDSSARQDSASSPDLGSADSLKSDSILTKEALELMKDLEISLKLRTESPIVETNASFAENQEVTLFQLDFDQILGNNESLRQLEKLKSQNIENIKDLIKTIPGIKIEPSKEIFIKFK